MHTDRTQHISVVPTSVCANLSIWQIAAWAPTVKHVGRALETSAKGVDVSPILIAKLNKAPLQVQKLHFPL